MAIMDTLRCNMLTKIGKKIILETIRGFRKGSWTVISNFRGQFQSRDSILDEFYVNSRIDEAKSRAVHWVFKSAGDRRGQRRADGQIGRGFSLVLLPLDHVCLLLPLLFIQKILNFSVGSFLSE